VLPDAEDVNASDYIKTLSVKQEGLSQLIPWGNCTIK
jgi:hypothetical protein